MRTYYIFKINKYFAYIYKKWPYKMYKIIEELYYTKDYDMLFSYKYNKLTINTPCIMLKTDDIYSVFLNDLNEYMDNIFICDFKNKDYFWLESLNKDRQNNLSLV